MARVVAILLAVSSGCSCTSGLNLVHTFSDGGETIVFIQPDSGQGMDDEDDAGDWSVQDAGCATLVDTVFIIHDIDQSCPGGYSLPTFIKAQQTVLQAVWDLPSPLYRWMILDSPGCVSRPNPEGFTDQAGAIAEISIQCVASSASGCTSELTQIPWDPGARQFVFTYDADAGDPEDVLLNALVPASCP